MSTLPVLADVNPALRLETASSCAQVNSMALLRCRKPETPCQTGAGTDPNIPYPGFNAKGQTRLPHGRSGAAPPAQAACALHTEGCFKLCIVNTGVARCNTRIQPSSLERTAFWQCAPAKRPAPALPAPQSRWKPEIPYLLFQPITGQIRLYQINRHEAPPVPRPGEKASLPESARSFRRQLRRKRRNSGSYVTRMRTST